MQRSVWLVAEADERRPHSFHLIHKTSATVSRAAVVFKKEKDVLIHRDGTKFHAYVHEWLYCLHSEKNDRCDDLRRGCCDMQTWNQILKYRNYGDIQELQNVAEGMKMKG